jgi:hypothetical protein
MVAKLTRLTHKIAILLHLVAESCTICSSCSRQPVLKLLDTHSYVPIYHSQSVDILGIYMYYAAGQSLPCHEGVLGEWRCSSTHPLTLVLEGGGLFEYVQPCWWSLPWIPMRTVVDERVCMRIQYLKFIRHLLCNIYPYTVWEMELNHHYHVSYLALGFPHKDERFTGCKQNYQIEPVLLLVMLYEGVSKRFWTGCLE